MTFHPLSGLFSSGEGPALLADVPDVCAFEEAGRWRTTRCGSTDVAAVVEDAGTPGDEPLLCAPHAERWGQTTAVREGIHSIHPLYPPEEGWT